ncbi:MAG: IreB family regulatory phosphoprotein [Lachnospiraceae bacterium]|nr:IreB family regulatory phosphoprotein [Lachnospiraceae bacterium]
MSNVNDTQYFKVSQDESENNVEKVLDAVCHAMIEKGYNPQSQIVGYIMSGDPTYITSHKGARSMIMKLERDEILEELMHYYLENRINRR